MSKLKKTDWIWLFISLVVTILLVTSLSLYLNSQNITANDFFKDTYLLSGMNLWFIASFIYVILISIYFILKSIMLFFDLLSLKVILDYSAYILSGLITKKNNDFPLDNETKIKNFNELYDLYLEDSFGIYKDNIKKIDFTKNIDKNNIPIIYQIIYFKYSFTKSYLSVLTNLMGIPTLLGLLGTVIGLKGVIGELTSKMAKSTGGGGEILSIIGGASLSTAFNTTIIGVMITLIISFTYTMLLNFNSKIETALSTLKESISSELSQGNKVTNEDLMKKLLKLNKDLEELENRV